MGQRNLRTPERGAPTKWKIYRLRTAKLLIIFPVLNFFNQINLLAWKPPKVPKVPIKCEALLSVALMRWAEFSEVEGSSELTQDANFHSLLICPIKLLDSNIAMDG